ncbi:MAG: cytochrome b [Methylophaga sp.]
MPSPDTIRCYDRFSVLLHWSIAVLTIALFFLGLWMVDLGYYDDWYYRAPWWHKGLGVITVALVVIRGFWQLFRQNPDEIHSIPIWQRIAAKLIHILMNLAIILLFVTGYLMVTAKGDALGVFDWFSIPSLIKDQSGWAEFVGSLHLWIAWAIIALASLHALAALKHHFIDKDATLKRMFAIPSGDE